MSDRLPLLALDRAGKAFRRGRGRLEILRDIDLEIETGEFVSIMGPSGSGKSTLLNLLSCLDSPSSGRYRIAGRDVTTASVRRLAKLRKRHFGFIFQSFHLLPRATAFQNVALPLAYRGVGRRETKRRVREILAALGLEDRMKHRPDELSGGEQQRVAIARAVITEPDVIFADEPTGALDTKSGEAVLDLLRSVNGRGMTLVMVTHDPAIAAQATRTIRLLDGRITDDRATNGSKG